MKMNILQAVENNSTRIGILEKSVEIKNDHTMQNMKDRIQRLEDIIESMGYYISHPDGGK